MEATNVVDLIDDDSMHGTKIVKDISTFNEMVSDLNNCNILQHNFRSISKNFDQLVVFLEACDIKFSVIILTETSKIHNIKYFELQGYSLFYNESHINKADGCIVYVRNDLKLIVTSYDTGKLKFIRIIIGNSLRSIGIVANYRPPSSCEYDFVIDKKLIAPLE